MMTALDNVTAALARAGSHQTRANGDWTCPAHEDHNPSLSVRQGQDAVVLHCHAGCDTADVLKAIGLRWRDLHDEPLQSADKPRIVATYPYMDENGELLYEVVRYDPKDFRQRRPDGNGGWVWRLDGVQRVPYRLPELLAGIAAGHDVYIAEGERDVDALVDAGVVATCNSGGAGKWTDGHTRHLRGAHHVNVIADRDEAGYEHARQVADSLRRAGIPHTVVRAPNGKDAAEHLGAGREVDDFELITSEELDRLAVPNMASVGGDAEEARPDAWPLLDKAALVGPLGEAVGLIAPISEADPVAILLSLLVGFGNIVGPNTYATVGAAHHPGRLFVSLVGKTAKARKGTSWRDSRPVVAGVDPRWAEARIVGGLSSGEGLIGAVANHDGPDGASAAADPRLMVLEEEFARTLTACRREASTLSPVVRQAWDDGDLSVLTKNRQTARGAHVSVISHITVEELRSKLTETDMANGLANRFLFACVRRAQLLPAGAAFEPAALAPVITSLRRAADHWRQHPGALRRSPDAESRWADLYAEMDADTPGGMLGALTARPEAQTLRLSLIYALTCQAAEIELEHLEAAWAVWRYCRQSVEYIFGDTLGDPDADKLRDAIRCAGAAGLDGTEQSRVFNNHLPAGKLEALRSRLAREGIVTLTTETGGRPKLVSYDSRFAPRP
jgi:hypothetical protein